MTDMDLGCRALVDLTKSPDHVQYHLDEIYKFILNYYFIQAVLYTANILPVKYSAR